MTHLDLFSGIGGFALAARWAGFSTVAFAEIDRYCVTEVLSKQWPGVPNLGDIRRHDRWPDLGRIDLITGGFPCQGHSCAGKRRGQKDPRWLWPQMCQVIGRYKPRWVVAENVPGLIKMDLDQVLFDLENYGYTTGTLDFPACAVGSDQRRQRIWIIANSPLPRCEDLKERSATLEEWRKNPSDSSVGTGRSRWRPEPRLVRMVDGLPNRMDRLKRSARVRILGNAIVPQIAFEILQRIASIEGASA